jgi:hypothetical protein
VTTVQGSPVYPYVLLWGPPGSRPHLDLAATRGLGMRLGVTSVGLSDDSVRITSQRVFDALDGWSPGVIDGRHVDELRFRDGESVPIARDPDTPPVNGAHILTGVDFYDVSSTPA